MYDCKLGGEFEGSGNKLTAAKKKTACITYIVKKRNKITYSDSLSRP